MIISAALDAGLERSGVVGSDINEERQAVEDISQVCDKIRDMSGYIRRHTRVSSARNSIFEIVARF